VSSNTARTWSLLKLCYRLNSRRSPKPDLTSKAVMRFCISPA
jgi:hypothetical protein